MYRDKIVEQVEIRGYCVYYSISEQSGYTLFDLIAEISEVVEEIVRGIRHVQR